VPCRGRAWADVSTSESDEEASDDDMRYKREMGTGEREPVQVRAAEKIEKIFEFSVCRGRKNDDRENAVRSDFLPASASVLGDPTSV
jgi:hypothetical protein